MFESIEEIKWYLKGDGEELDLSEVWEIVKIQQELDIFVTAYHY